MIAQVVPGVALEFTIRKKTKQTKTKNPILVGVVPNSSRNKKMWES